MVGRCNTPVPSAMAQDVLSGARYCGGERKRLCSGTSALGQQTFQDIAEKYYKGRGSLDVQL
jgi:hypothetical protein